MFERDLTRSKFNDKLLWQFCTMAKTDNGYELFKSTWWGKDEDSWWLNNKTYSGNITGDKGSIINYTIYYNDNKIEFELAKNKRRKGK